MGPKTPLIDPSPLMKLYRKIKKNKVCCLQDLGSYAQGQGHNQVRGQNRVSAITRKTAEANLTKLHRKVKHNEKVCCIQELGSYAQDQGHNQVGGQIVPNIVLHMNY